MCVYVCVVRSRERLKEGVKKNLRRKEGVFKYLSAILLLL